MLNCPGVICWIYHKVKPLSATNLENGGFAGGARRRSSEKLGSLEKLLAIKKCTFAGRKSLIHHPFQSKISLGISRKFLDGESKWHSQLPTRSSALTRPAAIAAQRFVDETGGCVAILDVDYHHGNGTQSIFYDRSDVLFLSIHGDPNQEFPYYLGYATEQGEGAGEGFNRNFPLPWGTTPARWFEALRAAHRHIEAYQPDLLIVSLGVDTFRGDPISHFLLDHDDFARMGEAIAGLALPTLFVQEGGYAVEEIGVNVVQVLGAFDAQVS